MRSAFFKTIWIPLVLFIVFCWAGKAVPGNKTEIKIAGGSTALGLIQQLSQAFEESHPGISVRLFPETGSIGGFKAAAAGAIDIGLMGRPLRGDQLNAGLISIEYAKTPLAFIARGDVNISDVTTEDLVKIYRGETTVWPNGKRIRLILYTASDTETVLLKQISTDMSSAMDHAMSRPGMIIALSTQDGYDKVRQTPGSLGFCALTKVQTEQKSVKILSYNGILPTVKNLKNGSYPLFKSLYLVIKSNASEPVHDFVDFVFSSKGKRILEEAGNMAVSGRSKLKI